EIIDQLGQGGMGTVYLARDQHLRGRTFVVKKLRDDFFRDEDREKAMEFFKREIDVLSQLRHPNIVDIRDHFAEGDDYYIVMEYVEGKNLHEMLHERGEPFSEEQVVLWARQICEVLHYLHTHDPPIIYRDLKPSNIMIDTLGRVKLVDFGIAREYQDDSDNTHVVSAGYSPPEQYWGAAEPRSDIYALGATMHFLLTGQEPLALQASSPKRVFETIAAQQNLSAKKINEAISDHVDRLVFRATAQDIWLRFQSALEMLEELEYKPEVKKGPPPNLVFVAIAATVAAGLLASIMYFGWHSAFATRTEKPAPAPAAKKGADVALWQKKIEEERQLREKTEQQLKVLQEHMRSTQSNSAETKALEVSPPPLVAGIAKPKEPEVMLKEDSEAQLTDPEGLAPIQEEPPKFGIPLFRSTDNQ
ncbi:MAG TPA: serine/threonine-protein kinase, partial [Candidatus Obscuribacterales bacterium]